MSRNVLAECNCPADLACDCLDLRSLLYRILTSREYGRMEAEGLAADALGLRWSATKDGYVSPDDLIDGECVITDCTEPQWAGWATCQRHTPNTTTGGAGVSKADRVRYLRDPLRHPGEGE